MAEVVNEMPAPRQKGSIFSWFKWFDGQVWKLVRGTDFNTIPAHFVNTCHVEAKRHGGKVITRRVGDDVYVKFYKEEPADAHRR